MVKFFLILFAGLCSSLIGQKPFNHEVALYPAVAHAAPVALTLTTKGGWVEINRLNQTFLATGKQGSCNAHWRAKVAYRDFDTSNHIAVQMKIDFEHKPSTLFTFPWLQKSSSDRHEQLSDWLDCYSLAANSAAVRIWLRLLGAPETRAILHLTSLALEERRQLEAPETLLVRNAERTEIPVRSAQLRADGHQQAVNAAIVFLQHRRPGSPARYQAQNIALHQARSAEVVPQYSLPIALEFTGQHRRENFEYSVYDYQQMQDLYSEWLSDNQKWQASIDSLLFVGRPEDERDIVALLLEPQNEQWRVRAQFKQALPPRDANAPHSSVATAQATVAAAQRPTYHPQASVPRSPEKLTHRSHFPAATVVSSW